MTNKASKYVPPAVVVLVILVIAGIQLFKQDKPSGDGNNPPAGQQQQNGGDEKEAPSETPGVLEGTLKISDDLKRGNLMLVASERIIYLFTSRDYSALLDKKVRLEIEGTLENFSLVDIKEMKKN